jgi:hypothetical protein
MKTDKTQLCIFPFRYIKKCNIVVLLIVLPHHHRQLLAFLVLGKHHQNNDYTDLYFFSFSRSPNFNLDSTLTSLKVDQERENGTLTYIFARNKYEHIDSGMQISRA